MNSVPSHHLPGFWQPFPEHIRVNVQHFLCSSQTEVGGRDTPGWVELPVSGEPSGLEASGSFLSVVQMPTQSLAMDDCVLLLSLSVPVCEMGMKVAILYRTQAL